MFGSDILDVGIGLVVIYLLLALVVSAAREAIETVTKSRAIHLERAIRELLDQDAGLLKTLYEHPQLYSLYPGKYKLDLARKLGWSLPTYVPAANFARALMDVTARGGLSSSPYAREQTAPAVTVENIRASLSRIASPRVRRAMLTAIDTAGNDLAKVQANLEAWFNSAMERVSGAYKRRSQWYLFAIGLGVTVVVNIDTITLASYLARNRTAREALVARADAIARDSVLQRSLTADSVLRTTDARARATELATLDLPIGWDDPVPHLGRGKQPRGFLNDWILPIIGLLMTAFAITLGAPFWFDMLANVVNIRSTVRPVEKAGPPADGAPPPAEPPRAAGGVVAPEGAYVAPGLPAPATVGAVSPASPLGYTAQEWASGDAEEGIL